MTYENLANSSQLRAWPRSVSLVIPLFNEEKVFADLKERLEVVIPTLSADIEILLVDDGSTDATRRLIAAWAKEDSRVTAIHFSRNFGHQAAISAGIDHAIGEVVVVMDGDLQDPPELVSQMIQRYCDGCDVVYAQRLERRGETFLKTATAAIFYRLMRALISPDFPVDTGDFRLLSREVVMALRTMREHHRFVRGMIHWLGFHQTPLFYSRDERAAGTTKFGFVKMSQFALDAIFSFSAAPLRATLLLGVLLFGFAFGYTIYALAMKFVYAEVVSGWTSLIIMQALIGGATLLGLGMVGEYLARLYEAQKGRPLYIVARVRNAKSENVIARRSSRAQIRGAK